MSTAQLFRRQSWRMIALAMAAASLLAAVACGSTPRAAAANRLYAYPNNPIYAATTLLKNNGHQAEEAELKAIAEEPSGIWAAGQPGEMQEIRQVTLAATRAHAIPVIVVRGCLSPTQSAERYQLLRYAMEKLGALPRARVYLDAGNPGMFKDPSQLVAPLEQAGIRYGRGFSANVSNFQWTASVVTWSQKLDGALGGNVGAVIDTSRNGRGPYTGPDAPQWCNPPGRALGPAPRLHPGPAGIDAYLWIKDPGASDGPCNGGPPAGQYWPQYAVALEQASHQP
jgi:cellulase/cellobiase CelA1